MTYLLDTNVCIGYINGSAVNVLAKLQTIARQEVALCSVVKAELIFGAMKSQNTDATLEKQQQFTNTFVSLPFDDISANVYGKIRADLEKKGTPIGGNDLMIAATAKANNLILVTNNTREFDRVDGLEVEDWV